MKASHIREKYPESTYFVFGDNKELCERLISLVISGEKTATCDSLESFDSGNLMMPCVGRIDIATTWEGVPAVAIQTTEIAIMKFNEVDESLALKEGENDDLQGWQNDHKEYFERNGGFDPNMKLVCEHFNLVEVF